VRLLCIALLDDYADEIYNWSDEKEHRQFLKTIYDALPAEFFGQTRGDDLTKKDRRDESRINIHEDYEIQYWSKKFGVSPEWLKAAVKTVGNSAKAVEKKLRR
jgi:hypothetical protein